MGYGRLILLKGRTRFFFFWGGGGWCLGVVRYVEWLGDRSLNVHFPDERCAARAHATLFKPLPPPPPAADLAPPKVRKQTRLLPPLCRRGFFLCRGGD